jgi:hypothetical protein
VAAAAIVYLALNFLFASSRTQHMYLKETLHGTATGTGFGLLLQADFPALEKQQDGRLRRESSAATQVGSGFCGKMQSAAAILIAPGLSDVFSLKHLHRHCIQVTQQPLQRRQLLSRRALEFRQLTGVRGDACAVGSDSCVVCLNSYKLVLELRTCSGDSSGVVLHASQSR